MDSLFDSCQLTITWMSIGMSTIKLNSDCICLGHLATVVMPGHYKKTANKSVRTTVAIYYTNVISFLK